MKKHVESGEVLINPYVIIPTDTKGGQNVVKNSLMEGNSWRMRN